MIKIIPSYREYLKEQEEIAWVELNESQYRLDYGDDWETIIHLRLLRLNESEVPTNTTDGVVNPDAGPQFKVSRVAGVDCVEVDFDTYNNCRFGKKKYARWDSVVKDENLRNFLKFKFHRSNKLMLLNRDTNAAVLFKK